MNDTKSLIDEIIEFSQWEESRIPEAVKEIARLSLLDWLVCGIAGIEEPLATKLREFAASEGGIGTASLFGGGKYPARMAALVNGSTSHALDFDDTHFAHVGHLSVGIYPAVLAMAEERDRTCGEMVSAFAIGGEVAIRIGLALGSAHYNRGFHQTATAGAFGAVVAAGRLAGLTAAQLRCAIGLCATRASGLKSQFGTMGKPYNAGIAAANAIECVKLAALDFTSTDDGLASKQAFFETHSDEVNLDAAWAEPPLSRFFLEDNKYKFHACCHGLHAMIEAILASDAAGQVHEGIERVTIETNPRWLRVCDNKAPQSGLEVKFSYAWLAGMVLRGDATGNDKVYCDELASDNELVEFAKRVVVQGNDRLTDQQVKGEIQYQDGRKILISHDLAKPLSLDTLEKKLRAKALSLIGEKGVRIWALAGKLDELPAGKLGAFIGDKD